MTLFLFSNFIISAVAIVYFRYCKASIIAKLMLSTFATICWVIPFTLIRTYVPQKMVVDIEWLPVVAIQSASQVVVEKSSPFWEQLTLLDLFLTVSLLGLVLFVGKLVGHFKWRKSVENDINRKFVGRVKGIAYFSSPRIKHAVVIGYAEPTIWVNENLIDSDCLGVLLAHEFTHIKHKDNYWLALLEFFSSIYWWNPIFVLLSEQIKDGLESRCDYHAAQLFPEDSYRTKLTNLILLRTPISTSKFASAIISKNSNIRRLKLLKEPHTMNYLSKMLIGLLFLSCISLLTFPVASIKAMSKPDFILPPTGDGISLHFDKISIEALTGVIAKYLNLKPEVDPAIKQKFVSINLSAVPDERLLASLTNILRVRFVNEKDRLMVSEMAAHTISTTAIETEQVSNSSSIIDPDTVGVSLDLDIKIVTFTDGVESTSNSQMSLWSLPERTANIKIGEDFDIDLITKLSPENIILIDSKVYSNGVQGTRKLIASPRVFTENESPASIVVGNDSSGDDLALIRIKIVPKKSKYSEVSSKKEITEHP